MLAPYFCAEASALSGRVVQTAVNSTSGLATRAGRWARGAHPTLGLAPMTPRRILGVAIGRFSLGSEGAGALLDDTIPHLGGRACSGLVVRSAPRVPRRTLSH